MNSRLRETNKVEHDRERHPYVDLWPAHTCTLLNNAYIPWRCMYTQQREREINTKHRKKLRSCGWNRASVRTACPRWVWWYLAGNAISNSGKAKNSMIEYRQCFPPGGAGKSLIRRLSQSKAIFSSQRVSRSAFSRSTTEDLHGANDKIIPTY